MNFKTAYLFLKRGYKIRCSHWKEGSYWQISSNDEILMYSNHNLIDTPKINDNTITYLLMDCWEVIPKYPNQKIC